MESVDVERRTPPEAGSACGCPIQGGWVIVALGVVLAGVLAVQVFRPDEIVVESPIRPPAGDPAAAESTQAPATPPRGETVSLAIDFGNGVTRGFAALAWREDMTVANLTEEAARFKPGMRFTRRGEGDSAFLTAIDGIASEGRGGRNWIFYVGKTRGKLGFGAHRLNPGDDVLWKYEPYE